MKRLWQCLRTLRKFKNIDSITHYRALCLYSRLDIREIESFIHMYDRVPLKEKKNLEEVMKAFANSDLLPSLEFAIKTYLMFTERGLKPVDVTYFDFLVDNYLKNKLLLEKFENQTIKNN